MVSTSSVRGAKFKPDHVLLVTLYWLSFWTLRIVGSTLIGWPSSCILWLDKTAGLHWRNFSTSLQNSSFGLGSSLLHLTGASPAPGPPPSFPYFELSDVTHGFGLQLLSQWCGMCNCLCRSIPQIHSAYVRGVQQPRRNSLYYTRRKVSLKMAINGEEYLPSVSVSKRGTLFLSLEWNLHEQKCGEEFLSWQRIFQLPS